MSSYNPVLPDLLLLNPTTSRTLSPLGARSGQLQLSRRAAERHTHLQAVADLRTQRPARPSRSWRDQLWSLLPARPRAERGASTI